MSMKNKIKYHERYKNNGCTKEQLKRLVELQALTAGEYEEITNEAYSNE